MEELGGRQNYCLDDGSRHWGRLRGGKEAEEKTPAGLLVRQPEEP